MRTLLAALLLMLSAASLRAAEPRTIDWEELIPAAERERLEAAPMVDHDGGRMSQLFVDATMVAAMDGVRGRLPGYVVPISSNEKGELTELFLVPYFGACIHMPPPPPNQIIYIRPTTPLPAGGIWDAYHAVGTLKVDSTDLAMAKSGYRMELEALELIEE